MTKEEAISLLSGIEFNETGDVISHTWWNTIQSDMTEALKMAVSALSAEPNKGEWIRESLCGYRCNQCGKIQIADDINELNFCCNCGAKMMKEVK